VTRNNTRRLGRNFFHELAQPSSTQFKKRGEFCSCAIPESLNRPRIALIRHALSGVSALTAFWRAFILSNTVQECATRLLEPRIAPLDSNE
jgi:hypothetical protein